MSGADLFVVCKSCQAEVSPYVTECPYCGARLRKRAPKLPGPGEPPRPPRRARARRSLGRLRTGEIPGIRADTRPWATIALIVATGAMWLAWQGGFVDVDDLVVSGPLDGEWWRVFTTQLVFLSGLAQFFALVGLGVFGWLLERRWGWPAVVAIVVAAGPGGTALAVLAQDAPFAVGGVGGALGVVCAWAAPELLARRRGEETDSDLLGTAAIGIVVALIPLARTEVDPLTVAAGGVIGALLGILFARVRPYY